MVHVLDEAALPRGPVQKTQGVALLAIPVTTPDPLSRWLAADPDPVAVAVSSYGYGLGKTSLDFLLFTSACYYLRVLRANHGVTRQSHSLGSLFSCPWTRPDANHCN